jgi:hypothetical protein
MKPWWIFSVERKIFGSQRLVYIRIMQELNATAVLRLPDKHTKIRNYFLNKSPGSSHTQTAFYLKFREVEPCED